jgi:hypothetical protein
MKPKDSKKVPARKANNQINRLLKMAKNLDYKKQLTFIKTIPFSISPVKFELYFDFQ